MQATPRPLASRRMLVLWAVTALFLVAPAAASAWTVTVHVHGAGKVDETTARNLMNCTTSSSVSESTVTDCVAGTASGLYNSFDIVTLQAQVPTDYYNRGWRFSRWVDSNAGGGQINCDPQDQAGNHTSVDCTFQIFENLQTNLYFDDIHGPNAPSISGGPASPTNSTSASFNFNASDDPDATFWCRLDPPGPDTGSYSVCGSPFDKSESYAGLTENGQYTFYVYGRDPSGNPGSVASRSWTVDTVAPTVTIDGTPVDGATTNSTGASFTVGSTEGTPTCTLDDAPTSCSTAKSGLGDGPHMFAAQATDSAGNTGSASRSWTVDASAPETTITRSPSGKTTDRTPTFRFESSEAGSTFKCSLDEARFKSCESPHTTARLAFGRHTFRVKATDAVGNKESGAASAAFKVVRR